MAGRSSPTLVSVVIPVRNGAATLPQQLEALAARPPAHPWELIIADNGSTDGTADVALSWRDRIDLRVVDATRHPGAAHARNVGIRAAAGDFIAFCDADDIVGPGWVDALAAAASSADIVGGRLEIETLNNERQRALRPPPQPLPQLHVSHGFLPYAASCNVGVWRDVFDAIGLWREDYVRGYEDVEFSWRAQLASYELAFAPDAIVHYRYRDEVAALRRQYFWYGQMSAKLYREYRSAGMRRPSVRVGLGGWAQIVRTLPALRRPGNEQWWRRAAFRSGRLVGSARFRVLCL